MGLMLLVSVSFPSRHCGFRYEDEVIHNKRFPKEGDVFRLVDQRLRNFAYSSSRSWSPLSVSLAVFPYFFFLSLNLGNIFLRSLEILLHFVKVSSRIHCS